MKRTSAYYPLKYRVDCKPSGQHFFETIAAFNSDRVALAYAKDCSATNPEFEYECKRRHGNSLWVPLVEELL